MAKHSKRPHDESDSDFGEEDGDLEFSMGSDGSYEDEEDEELLEDDNSDEDDDQEKLNDSGEGSDDEDNVDEKEDRMEELEKQFQELRSEQQSLFRNLKHHKDEDAAKGRAVKNQKVLWDKNLEFRFLLQKPFSVSNKLPKEPIRSLFCSSDAAVDEAYSDLVNSSTQTLNSMLELQKLLLEKNIPLQGKVDVAPDSKDGTEEWSRIHQMYCRLAPFRNSAIDKWQRKTQVTTGAAALKGKLHAFNQNVSDQVAGHMRDPSRLISRMQLGRSSVGVFGEGQLTSDNTKEDANADLDPELLDDSEFYEQLLKEFLESFDLGGSESAFYALRRLQPKKRKMVDRRASKSRKIRYNVHEKIVNFMAPAPVNLPPMAPVLFDNLFGLGGQKPVA